MDENTYAHKTKTSRRGILPIVLTLILIACVIAGLVIWFVASWNNRDVHTHTWEDATCTQAQTCRDCGDTQGRPLEHTWTEATCLLPQTCATCGATQGALLQHTWSEATCLLPQICTSCDATQGAALGHLWLEATCLRPQTCSVCEATQGDVQHQWQEATYFLPQRCTACGVTEGSPLIPEPTYLTDLTPCDKFGKLWILSEKVPDVPIHGDVSNGQTYYDMDTLGYTQGPVYDYLFNRYTCGLHIDGNDYASYYVSYDIGGIYTTFSGVCSMSTDMDADSRASKYKKQFEIYGDGVLLFTSEKKGQGDKAQHFEIDITGVQFLTIRYPKTSGPSRLATLFDPLLS